MSDDVHTTETPDRSGPESLVSLRDGQIAALTRARRYHIQRLTDAGMTLDARDEADIIKYANETMPHVQDGWYDAGDVHDTYGGISVRMRVWWHPESDRVRIDRPAGLDVAPNPPVLPPMRFGWRAGLEDVNPGMIYTYEGKDYTPAEAVIKLRESRHIEGWSWRPEGTIRVVITPVGLWPKSTKRPPEAYARIHLPGAHALAQPMRRVVVGAKHGYPHDLVVSRFNRLKPREAVVPDDFWDWDDGRVREWALEHLREMDRECRATPPAAR